MTPTIGSVAYWPTPWNVVEVEIIELGVGGRNYRTKRRESDYCVVRSELEGEFAVRIDSLCADPLAAAIASAELAREIEESD